MTTHGWERRFSAKRLANCTVAPTTGSTPASRFFDGAGGSEECGGVTGRKLHQTRNTHPEAKREAEEKWRGKTAKRGMRKAG